MGFDDAHVIWREVVTGVHDWHRSRFDHPILECVTSLTARAEAFSQIDGRSGRQLPYPASIVIRSVAVTFVPDDDPTRAKALEEIAALVKSAHDPRDLFHAAEAFFAAGRFAEAADLYGRVAAVDKDTLPLRRFIISLHNAGRRREARELFERIPADIRAGRRYAEIGATIYQQSGLLAEAKALLETTLTIDPDDLETRLYWMNITERLGQSDEVAAWLATVPADVQGKAEQLMQIAGAMDRLGVGGVILPIAYRALRAGYSNPRIHTTYTIGLFITGQTGREDLNVPEVCGPDVAVTLKLVEGEKRLSYVLETEPNPRIERQEIGLDNPLWTQLDGLKIGDVIELSNLGPTSIFYEVEALASKYLHAHFRSLREFATLFPDNKTLGQFEFEPEKGIEGVAATLGIKERADQGRQIEAFSHRNQFHSKPGVKTAIWPGVQLVTDRRRASCLLAICSSPSSFKGNHSYSGVAIKKDLGRLPAVDVGNGQRPMQSKESNR